MSSQVSHYDPGDRSAVTLLAARQSERLRQLAVQIDDELRQLRALGARPRDLAHGRLFAAELEELSRSARELADEAQHDALEVDRKR
jgi:hypothetical protein